MPESLVFSCAKILFLVSELFVAVKDRSLLTFEFLIYSVYRIADYDMRIYSHQFVTLNPLICNIL